MTVPYRMPRRQRGVTLFGLMFWAILIGMVTLVALKVLPTVNEFLTIKRTVQKVADTGGTTVPEVRAAFDKQKEIDYSITSISGKDLEITKQNDKLIVAFAYDKEIELMGPVYLLLKYEGQSK
ncbi:DUF4845 domain-containing protein [Rhizobacter sp. LjRoot28]|uniref:DUF4845 domain-containing protein n=1 Tax=Rhizobacter sp. LjRoot28 TaxID=3342309 RepID=UPI003ECE8148